MILIALTAAAAAETGPVYDAYSRLMASGCDLSVVQVGTPIEARILRNTPYAMRGHTFRSPELNAVFGADGSWYRPSGSTVVLDGPDADCVAKLASREAELRPQFSFPQGLEKRLTADVGVFAALHRWSQLDQSPYETIDTNQLPDGTWNVSALYPGCHPEMECGGYYIQCPPGEEACIAGEAG